MPPLSKHIQGSQYELKDSPGSHPASLPVHTAQGFYPYGQYPYGDPSRAKTATRETTSTLKAWLQEHQKNPYPTKGEKIMLAIITRMTLTQVGSVAVTLQLIERNGNGSGAPACRPDYNSTNNYSNAYGINVTVLHEHRLITVVYYIILNDSRHVTVLNKVVILPAQ